VKSGRRNFTEGSSRFSPRSIALSLAALSLEEKAPMADAAALRNLGAAAFTRFGAPSSRATDWKRRSPTNTSSPPNPDNATFIPAPAAA
jgi:hypothetical protein